MLFLLPRPAFGALVALVAAIAGREWAALGGLERGRAWAFGVVCALLYLAATRYATVVTPTLGVATVFWLVLAPLSLAGRIVVESLAARAAVGLLVIVPAALAMALLPVDRLLMLLGLVWTADIAAYAVGRALGRRKLAPSISPGKTLEGAAGGLVASVIYAIIWASFDPVLGERVHGALWAPYLAAAGALFGLSVIGDLFESGAKRRAGVKDSGTLLPGHGGVLDRIDSAAATLPAGALLMHWTGLT